MNNIVKSTSIQVTLVTNTLFILCENLTKLYAII